MSSRVQSSPGQPLKLGDRRLGGLATGVELLALARAVVLHLQATDEPRKGQALHHQRREDDAEREEDQQIPLGEIARQRKRGGQRDRATQAAPGADQPQPPPHPPRHLGGAPVHGPDDVGQRVEPQEPRAHHRPAHQQGEAGQLGRRPVLVGEDLRKLEPDQDEQHRVHQEDEDLPEGIAAKPGGGGGHVGRPVPHDHADGHCGQNAGHAHLLGREVPDVATGERDHDAHHVVTRDPLQHLDHHEAPRRRRRRCRRPRRPRSRRSASRRSKPAPPTAATAVR